MWQKSYVTNPYCQEYLEVNTRSVFAMRPICKGRAFLDTFAGLMGILTPVSAPAYSTHNVKLANEATAEKEAQFSAAAEHLCKHAVGIIVKMTATCDGTRSRRCHYGNLWHGSYCFMGYRPCS